MVDIHHLAKRLRKVAQECPADSVIYVPQGELEALESHAGIHGQQRESLDVNNERPSDETGEG